MKKATMIFMAIVLFILPAGTTLAVDYYPMEPTFSMDSLAGKTVQTDITASDDGGLILTLREQQYYNFETMNSVRLGDWIMVGDTLREVLSFADECDGVIYSLNREEEDNFVYFLRGPEESDPYTLAVHVEYEDYCTPMMVVGQMVLDAEEIMLLDDYSKLFFIDYIQPGNGIEMKVGDGSTITYELSKNPHAYDLGDIYVLYNDENLPQLIYRQSEE